MESTALVREQEPQAPDAAQQSKASDRAEDPEQHSPPEGDHGREKVEEPEAPAIAANPQQGLPSAKSEHPLWGTRRCRVFAVGGGRLCDRSECGLIARTADAARVHDPRKEKTRCAERPSPWPGEGDRLRRTLIGARAAPYRRHSRRGS